MGLGPKRAHSINKQGTPLFEIAMFYNNVPDYQLQKKFFHKKKIKRCMVLSSQLGEQNWEPMKCV